MSPLLACRSFSSEVQNAYFVACEQALRGDLAAGREKEGELATTSLEFKFHLQHSCGSPLSEVSDFGQSAQTRNKIQCNKHV